MISFKKVDKVSVAVTVVGVAAIILAILAIWTVISTEEGRAPRLMGISVLQVITGSMEPEIPTGSVVFVREVPPEELEVGDIIAYYSSDPNVYNMLITHRIIEVNEYDTGYSFTTQGDANQYRDLYGAPQDRVLGKVVFHSKLAGEFVKLIGSKYGFILFIIVPLGVIFLVNFRDLIRLFRQEIKNVEDDDEDIQ